MVCHDEPVNLSCMMQQLEAGLRQQAFLFYMLSGAEARFTRWSSLVDPKLLTRYDSGRLSGGGFCGKWTCGRKQLFVDPGHLFPSVP
jgi:hypothetical protein